MCKAQQQQILGANDAELASNIVISRHCDRVGQIRDSIGISKFRGVKNAREFRVLRRQVIALADCHWSGLGCIERGFNAGIGCDALCSRLPPGRLHAYIVPNGTKSRILLIMTDAKPKLTIPDLAVRKRNGDRLVMVAIADFLTATWAARAGVDIVGVGDSLGMTVYGHENTLPMTVDQMIGHTQAVRRGAPETFCIVSMPYGSYATREVAVLNAVRMMKESGADAVKLQGGREMFDIIKAVADAGCSGHESCWLVTPFCTPFTAASRRKAARREDALKIIDNARAIEEAGAIGLEIEAMPYEVGKAVDDAVSIFTFSIGAGAAGTCQLLNGYDLMGAFDSFKPKFAKRYGNIAEVATKAFADFADDVRSGRFPDTAHSYQMKPEEAARLASSLTDNGDGE